MFTLVTSWYHEPHEARRAEFIYCLEKNIANPFIERVVIMCETMEHLPIGLSSKVVLLDMSGAGRTTYQRMVSAGYEFSDHVLLANSDIYFDETLEKAFSQPEGTVYAISRYDLQPDGSIKPLHFQWTQDAWIFKGIESIQGGNYGMGIPGCDHSIIHELRKEGFTVINPCKSITIVHVHESDIHTYTKDSPRVDCVYEYAEPCEL